MTVVAELKIFLDRDPYTEPPGVDLEGRNIFRVSLERLDALDELTGPEYADVLAFARAACLERLGRWAEAAAAFERAAGQQTALATTARERARLAGEMAHLTNRARFGRTLEGYLNDLEVLQRRMSEWIERDPPFPYAAFARRERERAQEEALRLLLANRLAPDGVSRLLESGAKLIDDNPDSARRTRHLLLMGDAFETLARDLTGMLRPEEAAFDPDQQWSEWIAQARALYREVAHADGDPIKPEGQARLRALDTYARRVRAQAR